MPAVRTRMVAMDLVQNLASGDLAQPKSVLALAPPCGALVLALPPFGLAGAWAAPPLFFLSFDFPFSLPEVTLCSKAVRLREGRQWATILAQALAESLSDASQIGFCAQSKSEQLHSPAAVTPPTSNYLFIRVVAERPLLPTDALACTAAAICRRRRTDTKWTHYANK